MVCTVVSSRASMNDRGSMDEGTQRLEGLIYEGFPAIDVLMLDNFLRVVLLNSASLISIAEDPCRAEISISTNGVCCRASGATYGIGGLCVYVGLPVDGCSRCCGTAEIITWLFFGIFIFRICSKACDLDIGRS